VLRIYAHAHAYESELDFECPHVVPSIENEQRYRQNRGCTCVLRRLARQGRLGRQQEQRILGLSHVGGLSILSLVPRFPSVSAILYVIWNRESNAIALARLRTHTGLLQDSLGIFAVAVGEKTVPEYRA
jgi:hypothetical protein